uniref:Putative secreted protein n=1 Tax=Anopheles marajoara TaxID=58244 RepID=A0A2M4CEW5_9DIPT
MSMYAFCLHSLTTVLSLALTQPHPKRSRPGVLAMVLTSSHIPPPPHQVPRRPGVKGLAGWMVVLDCFV